MRSIKRSRAHDSSIEQLNGQQDAIFQTLRELYVFAAFLGFSLKCPATPVGPFHELDGRVFEEKDTLDAVLSLAFADIGQKEALGETDAQLEAVALTFEKYLEGGLAVIDGWLKQMPTDTVGDRALIQGMQERGVLSVDLARPDFENVAF